uniref:Uncharacterized protein n=1 Tax=Varanus komodoensis TaxID=61221 RepID=A0A8D2JE36_VARKO
RTGMTMKPALPLLLLGGLPLLQLALALKISAFNIRTFGDKKLSNLTIADTIVRVVSTYDITLVQEVRDADLSAVKQLLDQLDRCVSH